MDHFNVPKNSMEKERKAKKKWISELMEEKETREAIDFLHKLNGKDFLFYVQLISDLHRLGRKSYNLRLLSIHNIEFNVAGTSWRRMGTPLPSFMFREKWQI